MSWLDRKYTHGENRGSLARFYYREGVCRRYVDIKQADYRWYFYIKKTDATKNKSYLLELKNQKKIKGFEAAGEYVKVFVYNKNLSRFAVQEGQEDDKIYILNGLKALKVETFEDDLSPVERLQVDYDIKMEDTFNIGFFDIETSDENPGVVIGSERILSIAIVDGNGIVKYITNDNEKDLLLELTRELKKYSIISGYYSAGFDLPYIQRRCEIYDIEFNTRDQIHIDLMERIMDLYKMDKNRPRNWKLDTVAEYFLGYKKKDIGKAGEGRFLKRWKEQPEEFKEYNITDVKLLLDLNEKLDIIPMMLAQCKLCGIFLNQYWNTNLTDKYLLRAAKRRGVVLPSRRENPRYEIPGGRVYIYKPGVYNGVIVYDFTGMYLNVMRSFKISPENYEIIDANELDASDPQWIQSAVSMTAKYTFKLIKEYCDENNILYNNDKWWKLEIKSISSEGFDKLKTWLLDAIGDTYSIKNLSILNLFLTSKQIKNDDGTFYYTIMYDKQIVFKKESCIVYDMLTEFLTRRNEAKKKIKELEHDKDSIEYKTWKKISELYKLMGNIVFGYFSCPDRRCYSIPMTTSITLGGQTINSLLKGGIEQKLGYKVIYGDTDSNFINCLLAIPNKYIPNPEGMSLETFKSSFDTFFSSYLSEQLKKYFNIDEHTMAAAYEKYYSHFLLISKKCYVGYNPMLDKWDAVGVDYIKHSTIAYAASLQKELINKLLMEPEFNNAENVIKWVEAERDKFFSMNHRDSINSFVLRRRISKKPEEYKNKNVQTAIVEKMWEEDDEFYVGDVLEYVIIDGVEKKQEGEELSRFISNPDLKLDLRHYWSKEIFTKLTRVLDLLYPDVVWAKYDPVLSDARDKRLGAIIKKLKSGKADKIEAAVNTINKLGTIHNTDKKEMLHALAAGDYNNAE